MCMFIATAICDTCLYLQLMRQIWEHRAFTRRWDGLYYHQFPSYPSVRCVLGLFGRTVCGLQVVSLDSDDLLKSAFTFKQNLWILTSPKGYLLPFNGKVSKEMKDTLSCFDSICGFCYVMKKHVMN